MAGEVKIRSYDRDQVSSFRKLLDLQGISPEVIAQFRTIILAFYERNGRDLPWRHTTDPYHILISEIMLQQTQVDRVVKKYPEFVAAFPTCSDLAKAPLPEILAVWQGMGYNRRAIALSECAKMIVEDYHGQLPRDIDVLTSFPGIGKATARSIAAFAFDEPVIFIETNIRRVFIHFFFADKQEIPDRDILPLVKQTLDTRKPRIWYSALMDYGTMLKTAVTNPNRRSAHYTRQSKFEGSDRQIRGIIIKTLLDTPELEENELVRRTGREPERVCRIVRNLEHEGFLIMSGTRVQLRKQ